MQRTRRQILDILKRRGRATLEELSKEVALSPVTVRVHLSVLQRDDLVSVEEVRGKVGRPYFVYSLTEDAEELFPKRYHALANRLL
ncbi:MAG TPA: winged helix-turn-helix transcriptional regulator, partial [Chloroflexota bacterium]|nr:winged helix-turn-helix transcriptional regulator [Chloroflexota bacterium]